MMLRKDLWFRLLGLLGIMALLVAGGSLLFRFGYNQGFLAGSLAADAEGGTQILPTLPYGLAPYGWYGHGVGFSPFGAILGLLFFGGLILLVFGLFNRSFRHQHGPFGRWLTEAGSDWGPGAWEANMKAWHQAHESPKEANQPDIENEAGEPPSE
jgi:hypothetical protein